MATTADPAVESFSAEGYIFDAVSKHGVGNLLITAYHIEAPGPEVGLVDAQPAARRADTGSRLGSVLSDDTGHFALHYDQHDIAAVTGHGTRLNLQLVVSAPDDESSESSEKVIYRSDPRENAGRVEHFNIGVSRSTLEAFGLHREVTAESSISAYVQDRTTDNQVAQGVAAFHRETLEHEIAGKAALREELLNQIATNLDVAQFPGQVVRDGEPIRDKVTEVAADAATAATETIEQARGVPVNLFLLPEDRERLAPFFNQAVDGFADIPEFELLEVLSRTNSSQNPGTLLVHHNPIAKFCADQSTDEACATQHTGLTPETPDGEHDEGPIVNGHRDEAPEETTSGDSPLHSVIAGLFEDLQAPDSVFADGVAQHRPTQADVTASVNSFALDRGPADAPAFYDFHSLQIAFDHVWKILIDEEAVNVAYRLDRRHRERTGLSLTQGLTRNWSEAFGLWSLFGSVEPQVPADVMAHFDITLEEWEDLNAAHHARLSAIARELSDTEGRQSIPVSIETRDCGTIYTRVRVPGGTRFGSVAFEKHRQDLREQGERLIESVRHDDYYTLHKTLRDLHERLNSDYEFTVFAADRNVHSVNFGVLNTYRQQWTPINYQPGKLVKTIPLSPKEERKYSYRTKRTAKFVEKEAIKNSSTISSEQATTTRAETDIVKKAQDRTNFTLSTEGTYNIGISKGKANTTFGVDSLDESANNRKDFREAVNKAAQEYKNEYSTEFTTEETSSFEFEESGTIVNPNDELSVTYLFYELQRRYRISEQLYRVQPVVLVAQQVPAPHEITEAWVIAHDWIINRYLLDDSFRPALEYLANKSTGDDFALRELRKNLRQQRNLVDTLRLELSHAREEADSRYRALERAVEKRIGEQAAENTDGWFSDIGEFFGGGGQDPEAAKARELAAKDAHQHAVEQAEKAAAAMQREVNQLHKLTMTYNDTLREHLNNETRVKRLLVHLRNNIFYYMQAVWGMEPPDQRFLRLHRTQVPQLELEDIPDPNHPDTTVPDRRYRVQVEPSSDIFSQFREPGTTKHRAFMTGRIKPVESFVPKALVEVADLDNLLGFKGNYMIFPLKEHNALTDFMAAPYVDAAFGAMDPNELANVNLEDYARYICCLRDHLPEEQFEAMKPALKEWLKRILADPLRSGDEIIVPTDSLFIEALPGTHPLLEDFKLRHRQLDAYKAAEDVRHAQLENLRLGARLVHNERGDPDIEKKIIIDGEVATAVDPADL